MEIQLTSLMDNLTAFTNQILDTDTIYFQANRDLLESVLSAPNDLVWMNGFGQLGISTQLGCTFNLSDQGGADLSGIVSEVANSGFFDF